MDKITPPPMPKEVEQWSIYTSGDALEAMLQDRDARWLAIVTPLLERLEKAERDAAGIDAAIDAATRLSAAPVAIMDTRDALGLCAPAEEDFPALYALQGRRVALVDLGPSNQTGVKQ